MNVVAFRREHLGALSEAPALTAGEADGLERALAYTALDDAGKPIGCAGVVRVWEGRYAAWAFFGRESEGHMRRLTKTARAFLDTLDARRIELSVVKGFKQGHQWAKMLGFTLETPEMPGYGVDGATHAMYVRLKGA